VALAGKESPDDLCVRSSSGFTKDSLLSNDAGKCEDEAAGICDKSSCLPEAEGSLDTMFSDDSTDICIQANRLMKPLSGH